MLHLICISSLSCCSFQSKMARMVFREAVLPAMMVIFFLVSSRGVQVEAAMDIQFNNNFPNQAVDMHCSDEAVPGGGGSLGHHTLHANGGWYTFTVPGAVYSKDYYRCAFQTYQKPLTYIDVFIGFGGYNNKPCNCLEGQACVWNIMPTGISCNHDTFVHKW